MLFDIKQKRRARISVYADEVPGSEYHEGCKGIWTIPCDIAMPCASQNEMDLEGAKAVIANGAMAVFEGANMPLTPEAINAVIEAGLLYTPGKASNAGGVATSGLEMSQNSLRMSWSFEEVDEKLHGIMKSIFKACYDASVECGQPGNMMLGANVAGFLKVANAMMAQGIVGSLIHHPYRAKIPETFVSGIFFAGLLCREAGTALPALRTQALTSRIR